ALANAAARAIAAALVAAEPCEAAPAAAGAAARRSVDAASAVPATAEVAEPVPPAGDGVPDRLAAAFLLPGACAGLLATDATHRRCQPKHGRLCIPARSGAEFAHRPRSAGACNQPFHKFAVAPAQRRSRAHSWSDQRCSRPAKSRRTRRSADAFAEVRI